MRRLVLPVLLCATLSGAGCAVAVPGRPVAAPPPVPGPTVPVQTGPAPEEPGRSGPGSGSDSASAGSGGARVTLVPDVLDDECLLDDAGFARLLGSPVTTPANSGSPRSCTTGATRGSPRPLASINVYRADPGPVVRNGRPLAGVGDGAAVVDTASGPTLQVAAGRYLVTVAVTDRTPSDDRWAEAGRAVVARIG